MEYGWRNSTILLRERYCNIIEENGLSPAQATAYAANSTSVPANFVDALHAEYNAAATSTITIKWQSSDSFEKNLERIITQKYLAIYPDGQEAWSEYRRTGYPRYFPCSSNSYRL